MSVLLRALRVYDLAVCMFTGHGGTERCIEPLLGGNRLCISRCTRCGDALWSVSLDREDVA